MDIDIIGGFTVTVEVTWRYEPASFDFDGGSPAEYPEVDVLGIQNEDGVDCTLVDVEFKTGLTRVQVLRMLEDYIDKEGRR